MCTKQCPPGQKPGVPYLAEQDHAPEEEARLAQLQEGEEVHALILGLLQQSVDPAVVPPHAAQAAHVPQHPPHHPWHPCVHKSTVCIELP